MKLFWMIALGLCFISISVNAQLSSKNKESAKKAMGTDNLLARETYQSVDSLLNQTADQISTSTPLLVGTLNKVDELETSSTFGRIVTEQIIARLAQTGYTIADPKVRNSLNVKQGVADTNESGEFLMSRDLEAITTEHPAAGIITGTYAVGGSEILVNLKMIDVATGRVIGADDYSVDLDDNVRRFVGSSEFSFYGSSYAY